MKFYIPTSSLNFDNILSSESIAPEIFYQERNYGYKSFEVVENINYQNSIVLITKMPKFLIHDTKRENYPMIIEVDIPETSFNSYGINMLQCVHEFDIYTANQTIHINPEICKIFFFDSKSLSSIKLKLSDSLTIKMGKFYHIGIAPKEIQFEWKNTYLPEEKNNQTQLDISEFIAKDDNINRVKGFLFAYVGGVLHSIPNDTAKMRKVCREIYNIISSILNDSSRIPNSFIESLNVLKNEFDKLDQDKNKLREIYNNLFLYTPDTKRIVDYFGENLIKKLICEKERITPYSFPKFSNNLSIEEWEKINFEILKFEKKDSPICTPQQVKDSIVNICIKENKLAKFDIRSIDEEQKNLYIDLLNNCFLHKDGISIDSVRIDKKKLGDDIAKKIKSHVGESEWEYSHKSYFTALRQNIANATPFDVTSSNSIIEQSIAAFLLKGENLSNLQKYLENNGIGDVSLAYGFWGASIGFANMPKTLTNELFLSDSIEYTSEIYKYIFKQVHGIELKGKIERKQESVTTISSKLNDNVFVKSKVEEKKEITAQQANGIETEYREKLKEIKLKESQINSIVEVCKKYYFNPTERLFSAISDIKGQGIGKATVEKIRNALLPNQQGSIQQHVPTLGFDFPPEKEFYLDDNAWSYIEHLPFKSQKIKDKVKKNLRTIQEGYRPNGYYFKRGDSNENKEVIKHFLVWNISEKNSYNKLQEYDFSNELREEIRKILESKYPN